MATGGGVAMFRPLTPGQAVAVLLLIENSGPMAPRWPDLRDRVLPTLLGNIRIANQGVPIQILMLVSSPLPEGPSSTSAPREYNELPELRFNYRNDNHISVATISRGVDFLSAVFPGQLAARHIFIIAASKPSNDQEGVNLPSTTHVGASSWQLLGHRLAERDISCHMIVNPNYEVQDFSDMFQTALSLQNREEVEPWFSVDPRQYMVCLSARREPHNRNLREISSCIDPSEPSNAANLSRCTSYPSDLNTLADTPSTIGSQSESTSPSLVSHLQQMHGMTKKKIYGVQPTREPFFRDDERIRDKYRQGPTPLAIPSSPPSTAKCTTLANRDARRAASRVRSLSVNSKTASNEQRPHPRRRSNSRRASRLSSPESPEDNSLQSPGSIVLPSIADVRHTNHSFVNNISSPVSPPPGPLYVGSHDLSLIDSPSEMNGTILRNTDIGLADPRWLHTPYDIAILPSLAPSYPSAAACPLPSGNGFAATSGDLCMQLPTCLLTPLDISTPPSPVKELASFGFSPVASQIPLDGNAPFIFSAEAEAQAAARLAEAGLQSSCPPTCLRFPDLPPLDNIQPVASSSIRQNTQEPKLSYSRPLRPIQTGPLPKDVGAANSPSSPTFGSSSSLTGWAG